MKNQLILVEGLTGLGKSTLAHFIARQFQYAGHKARWIHEGELSHPVSVELEADVATFMQNALTKWTAFVADIVESDELIIMEASFFNNLIETLFTHQVAQTAVLNFATALQAILQPTQPAFIYLTHPHTAAALAENFRNRGAGFQEFVLDYVVETPIAQQNGWVAEAGLLAFWRAFVALTDSLFAASTIDKLSVDVSTGNWAEAHQQVAAFLNLSLQADPTLDAQTAENYSGRFQLQNSDARCTIWYENGVLRIDLFQNAAAKLIPQDNLTFVVERWHFELHFALDPQTGIATSFIIGGQDIDYLQAVGLQATRVTA